MNTMTITVGLLSDGGDGGGGGRTWGGGGALGRNGGGGGGKRGTSKSLVWGEAILVSIDSLRSW